MNLQIEGARIDRLLMLGWGLTGRAVLEHARSRGVACSVSDSRPLEPSEREMLAARGVAYEEGGHTSRFLCDADAIVLSPGIRMDLPLLADANERRIPIFSELDVAWAAVRSTPIIAVTGTNGKSSVVTLIGALLHGHGLRPMVVGNIGVPFVGEIEAAESVDLFVVEASSFQLEQSAIFRPDVGVLLNLAPDHLERHGTVASYAAAKGRLFRRQGPDDTAVMPEDLAAQFTQGSAQRVTYHRVPLPANAGRLPPHQRANLQAAIAACKAFDPSFDPSSVPVDRVLDAVRLPYRMADVGIVDGVRVIDDSKATNPHAAIAALAAIDGPIVLMLGGRHKGFGYDALRDAVNASRVRSIVLFGEAGARLSRELQGADAGMAEAAGLAEAVSIALSSAHPGDVLLFSPACSSYDAYRSFEERGAAFDRLIQSQSGFEPG